MWITVILLLAILAALIFIDVRKPRKYPPGPPWLPVAGSLPYIAWKCREGTKLLSDTLVKMAKDYKTPVLGIRVGRDRMVVLCSYESIKEVLTREEFDGRPTGPFFEARTWGSKKGVITIDGPFWHEQRRFILRHLKDFGFARRSMEDLVKKEVSELIKYFMESISATLENEIAETTGGEAVSVTVESVPQLEVSSKLNGESTIWLHDAFGVSVLNTIWSMMAGVRYKPEDSELRDLQAILTQLFIIVDASGCPFSHFPFMRYIAPELSGYKQFVITHRKIWDFIHRELEKHKSTYQSGQLRDLMDVYLAQMETDKKEGKVDSKFDDAQLIATCMDLFMAGSETTSNALSFIFLYLTTHIDVQKKIQAEIDLIVERDRKPTLGDRPRMPYTEAVILESLRLFGAKSFGLAHRSLSDAWLQGYFIPKDTMILVSYSSIFLDKDLWGDPEAFRPERFLDADGKVTVPIHMLPFGIGKRRCMGESLAKANIFLFMTGLLQKFEFSIPVGDSACPATSVLHSGLTPSLLPYRARVKLRR